VRRFAEDFKGRLLTSITYLELQKYRTKLAKTPIQRKTQSGKKGKVKNYGLPTNATVNRYMSCLRHMFSCAVEIYCPEVKTRPERYIPINNDLELHLQEIRNRKVVSEYIVIDQKGRKLKDIKRAFKTACRSAKIHNFRIKDLRHTFASHFTMRTADLKSLQEILGHTNIKTTMRYSHLCEAHKAERMQQMNGLTSKSRTDVELFTGSGQKKEPSENR